MDTANIVEIEGLTHDYGEVVALRDLSLAIPSGVTGLVGAQRRRQDHDAADTPRAPPSDLWPVARYGAQPRDGTVGCPSPYGLTCPKASVYQKTKLQPISSVTQPRLAGLPKREARRRSSETLFLVGLEEERFRFLGDFSTGMQQRVKLAQAIVHDPDLLLLDEPASGLDPAGRGQMLQLIRRLGEFDINVIVSSHVLTDIEETCSWVVMLDAGDLLRSGPLQKFEKQGTVHVEVLQHGDRLGERLTNRGIGVSIEGVRLSSWAPGDETLEKTIIEEAVAVDSGLVRMARGSDSLEDLFLKPQAASE